METTPQSAPVTAATPDPILPVSETQTPQVAPAISDPAPATVTVPRMISGIDLVDFSGGGLQPEKAYLVKGGIGLGKSILGLQFLSRGLELQEPGILITNQKPADVLLQANTLGFNLDEAVKRGQLLILNTSNRYFELVESPADVMAIMEELSEYIRTTGAQRLVIDPVYALITTAYSTHFAVTIAQTLLNSLEEIPTTTLLIAGDEENPEVAPVVRVLEQNASGVISLQHDRNTGGRVMRLSKFRYGTTENLASHYRILNGRGLMNYQGENEAVVDVTQPWEVTDTSSRNVLLIGSNPETTRKVQEALGTTYTVSSEYDFHKGVERVQSERPGLVLVTPSRSIQAISTIVGLSQNSTSSIAFLSPATNRTTDKVLYLRAGADDFITEPFSNLELRARVDALVRRSGRRLRQRDSSISTITTGELDNLLQQHEASAGGRSKQLLTVTDDAVRFNANFRERLTRSIDTISKFDLHFALYWIKGNLDDKKLNQTLAKLCRQEDIVCRNANGEFVVLLAATDENGIKGFEARLDERLGDKFRNARRGHAVFSPGESIQDFTERAFGAK